MTQYMKSALIILLISFILGIIYNSFISIIIISLYYFVFMVPFIPIINIILDRCNLLIQRKYSILITTILTFVQYIVITNNMDKSNQNLFTCYLIYFIIILIDIPLFELIKIIKPSIYRRKIVINELSCKSECRKNFFYIRYLQ